MTIELLLKEAEEKGYVLFMSHDWVDGKHWDVRISFPGKKSKVFSKSSLGAINYLYANLSHASSENLAVALRMAIDEMDKKNEKAS